VFPKLSQAEMAMLFALFGCTHPPPHPALCTHTEIYFGTGYTKEQALTCLAYMFNNPTANFTLRAFHWNKYSGHLKITSASRI